METPTSPLPSGRREPNGSKPQPYPRVDWHDRSMPGSFLMVSDSTSTPGRGRKVYTGGVMTIRHIPGRIELIYSPARTSARAHPPLRGHFPNYSERPRRQLIRPSVLTQRLLPEPLGERMPASTAAPARAILGHGSLGHAPPLATHPRLG